MAYAEHLLVVYAGTLGPNEIWSTGFRCIPNAAVGQPVPTSDDLDGTVEDVQSDVGGWYANSSGGIAAGAHLKFLKMNWILPDGKYRDPVTHLHEYSPTIDGPVGPQTPDFTSTAISFQTGLKRGPAHRGRMYWPNFGLPLSSVVPSLVDASARANALTWLAIMIGKTIGTSYTLVVASRKYGVNRPVTSLAMGSVLDVQRRRKGSEPETFVTRAVAP